MSSGRRELPVGRNLGAAAIERRGVTLIELLIVMTILAILVSLLFPAIHAARTAAQRSACDNNVRQIDLALQQYRDVTRGFFPFPPVPDYPSGWAIAILPYTEEQPLADRFDYTQPLWSPTNLQIARSYRPPLLVCPVTPPLMSTRPGVEETNYIVVIDNERRQRRGHHSWSVKDAAEGSRFPWAASPEILPAAAGYPEPHPSAFELFFH